MKQGEAYWASHVAAMQKEKMPVSAYAKLHGLTASCLYYWQGKLKTEERPLTPRSATKFLALRVTENAPAASAGGVLVLGPGIRLELATLPTPEWLASFALAAAQGLR